MSKNKILLSIVIISFIINIFMICVSYYILYKYDLSVRIAENISPWITKIINKKVIEEKVEEYRQLKNLQSDITKAIDNVSPSVVSIVMSKDLKIYYEDPNNFYGWYITEKKEKVWWWSWIIISSDGYIITNKHVVQDPNLDYTIITKNWDNHKVDKIWLDPVLDIAILKIIDTNGDVPNDLVAAPMDTISNKVKIGDMVIAIWNALAEYDNSVTFGIISGKWRKLNESTQNSIYQWLYQTDASINPWNSGGPLLDIKWDVIWINTAITAVGQWIWFAIPVNKEFVSSTLDIIKKNWKIVRPFIWINYLELTKTLAKSLSIDKFEWLYIQDVVADSLAQKSWLKKWDIILELNWVKIDTDNNFIYQLYTYMPWEEIELKVFSNKEYKNVKMILWE